MSKPLLNNKGQIQIGESILVIIIILIVIVISMVFFFNQATVKYRLEVQEYNELDSIETAQAIANLQELACEGEGQQRMCIDLYKLDAFEKVMSGSEEVSDLAQDYYFDTFRYSKIHIKQTYPTTEDYPIYDRPINAFNQSITPVIIPVTLYNATTDTKALGLLFIERYHRLLR